MLGLCVVLDFGKNFLKFYSIPCSPLPPITYCSSRAQSASGDLPQPYTSFSKMASPGRLLCYTLILISLSSFLIHFNRYILIAFPFPTTLTAWHLTVSALGTRLLAKTTGLINPVQAPMGKLYGVYFIPIGISFSMNIILNNVAYMYLSVAFIQMFKSLGPVVVLLSGWAAGLYTLTPSLLAIVSAICIGIVISCYGEVRLHGLGLLIQSGALIFEAIRLIMTEKLLSGQKIRFTPLLSLYYLSPLCAGFCWVIALATERNALTVAFLLNIAAVFFISKSSSLSLALCGGPKAMMTIAASVWLWQDAVTLTQVGGFCLALLGLFFYNIIQKKRK
ncbi:unnamed protein product [Penicillium salamii]|uniref:Sugar phosphate transporter domain-containing protein n=1 Tax=Penicillium salamii TaxID=1612424 RepID=A0A9W4IZ08_9EURO|nr:unnamed protein product [Penicillium salamii]CAG8068938.1 unnamed protein product [Penicillium salamii]CAG8117082.1 unnamed protein product [Penicillium salamii]CAG8129745.1 unnamed protein product [Penicillium salamii]CAG8280556.1 unnamed protein product [Penicillium salamii]